MKNRIENFPIMMFTIVMGFSGLTIAYQKAVHVLHFPQEIAILMLVVTSLVFVGVSALYVVKILLFFDEVKTEYTHPVRINFFATFSISLLLFSIMYHDINTNLSNLFLYIGATLHLFLTLRTISFWIAQNQDITHTNPAWFLPIVGNVLVPIAGAGVVSNFVLLFFFSIGIFFWIILFAFILNRIIFHHQLAQKFLPTLFILIAPPAIGFIAYVKLNNNIDMMAMFLFNIAIFFTLLVLFMYKQFVGIKYAISWWAYIFPLAAITIASLLLYERTHFEFVYFLCYFLLSLLNIVFMIVLYNTLKNIKQKNICVAE
jgi:tellurite resistance protein